MSSNKINLSLIFWIYCALLVTFNELIGLFVPKSAMRAGYIFLMLLFFANILYKKKFKISVSRLDITVLTYIIYIFFRGVFQIISGNAITGTIMTWAQNLIPVLSYFIARNLKIQEREKIEYLFASFSAISVIAGFLNSKFGFLPMVGAFAGGLYADVGSGLIVARGYSMAGIALITGFICGFSLCCLLNLNIARPKKMLLFAINFAGCLYSLSRGALAFVMISFLLYFAILLPQKWQHISRKKAFIIAVCFATIIFIFLLNIDKIVNSSVFRRFVMVGVSKTEGSNHLRTQYQYEAFKAFMKHPLLGIGYGFTGYQAVSEGVKNTINTESYILSLSISAGSIGLLLFLTIAGASVIKIQKKESIKYVCTVMGLLAWSSMYILLDSDLIGLFYWYCIGALNERKYF